MLFHSLPLMPGHALSGILQGPFSEKTKAMQFNFSEVLQGIRLEEKVQRFLLWSKTVLEGARKKHECKK